GHAARNARLRRAPQLLHRGVQSSDAVSRHAALRAPRGRGAVALRPLVDAPGLPLRDGAVRAARHDGRRRGAALHRRAAPLLQPLVHRATQSGLSGQRPRMVHVEPLLLDQPAVSLRGHAAAALSVGRRGVHRAAAEGRTRPAVRRAQTGGGVLTMGIETGIATPADDEQIRGLLRREPVPGRIAISYEREPEFSRGCDATGENATVLVARDLDAGCTAAVACRSERDVYVNATATRL